MQDVYVGERWADPESSPGYVEQLLDAEGRIARTYVFLAEMDQVPIGTVTAAITDSEYSNVADDGELEVRMLAVLPHVRGLGVATLLMQACEELARNLGLGRIVLSTEERMLAARALYPAIGYRRAPLRDWAWENTQLLVFTKDLE